jgi:hypothetical protein
VTAGEHHFELAVLDFFVEKQPIEFLGLLLTLGSEPLDHPLANLMVPERIQNLVLCDAVHPSGGIVRDPISPRRQGIDQGRLHHVFDEIEVPQSENPRQNGHQPTGFIAEKVFHKGRDGLRIRGRHGFDPN